MSFTSYVLLAASLVVLNLIYFRIARYFNFFDAPNERSSHTDLVTIRSGGILFYLATLPAIWGDRLNQACFFAGLTIVTLISFWDDFKAVPIRYRLVAQFIAVGLLLLQTNIIPDQKWIALPMLIVGVGSINAYNFMDGINGMTAFYSLVTIATLWYQQNRVAGAVADSLLPFVFVALLIFSYFNARRQAICFAGDVGSMSIGFIILYVLLTVINQSHTYLPMLFLAVYGVDSFLTIVHRLYLRQSIFQAHRLHLFQLLVHQYKWPHLRVSGLYALIQAGINVLILNALDWAINDQIMVAVMVLSLLAGLYVSLKNRLMNLYNTEKGRFS